MKYKFEIDITASTVVHLIAMYLSYMVSIIILGLLTGVSNSALYIALWITIGVLFVSFIREKLEKCIEKYIKDVWYID